MNGPLELIRQQATIPAEFEVLSPPPLLLPGEEPKRYHALRHAIFADLAPCSAIEWLFAIDIAELTWEILRYRMLRHRLLEVYRQKAIESSLRSIDMIGIVPGIEEGAAFYTIQNALSWRLDPAATIEIEARLSSYGIDQCAINVEVYAQAREMLLLFESLQNAAQAKRLLLLKEIKGHQAAIQKAKRLPT